MTDFFVCVRLLLVLLFFGEMRRGFKVLSFNNKGVPGYYLIEEVKKRMRSKMSGLIYTARKMT